MVHYIELRRYLCSVNGSSHVLTICDPMDYGSQPPLSVEFSRQEYWSGLPFPSPEDLSDPGIKPKSPPL